MLGERKRGGGRWEEWGGETEARMYKYMREEEIQKKGDIEKAPKESGRVSAMTLWWVSAQAGGVG